MKKTLLTLTAMFVVAGAFAQGTINFNNRITGTLITHVYAPQASDPTAPVFGASSTDTPAGSTVYTGALITGAGWTAQLWSAPAGTTDENLFAAAAGGSSTFRTGTAAGNWVGATATLANVPKDAASAVLQVRVFATAAGSWANALATTTTYGKSQLFTVTSVGGDFNVPSTMANLTSFSLVSVPEPSSMALAGIGAASLLIFRRRK